MISTSLSSLNRWVKIALDLNAKIDLQANQKGAICGETCSRSLLEIPPQMHSTVKCSISLWWAFIDLLFVMLSIKLWFQVHNAHRAASTMSMLICKLSHRIKLKCFVALQDCMITRKHQICWWKILSLKLFVNQSLNLCHNNFWDENHWDYEQIWFMTWFAFLTKKPEHSFVYERITNKVWEVIHPEKEENSSRKDD